MWQWIVKNVQSGFKSVFFTEGSSSYDETFIVWASILMCIFLVCLMMMAVLS